MCLGLIVFPDPDYAHLFPITSMCAYSPLLHFVLCQCILSLVEPHQPLVKDPQLQLFASLRVFFLGFCLLVFIAPFVRVV